MLKIKKDLTNFAVFSDNNDSYYIIGEGDNAFEINANNGHVKKIKVDGEVESQSFYATSDRRKKENIIDYTPENSILDLPVKKFNFIGQNKIQIGCIAQDLQQLFPELVEENSEGYLTIQESKLVYLLLDEVKKLKTEVEKLKGE